MKEVILVPRRDDNGPRDELWDAFIRPWWEREQSHMPIFEGYHTEGLFNRSAALNTASRLAGDWDVAVIIDADVICNPERVKEAVILANDTGSMVLPHDTRKDLSPKGTRLVRAGHPGNWDRHVHREYSAANGHPSVSSVVVVPRRLWDEVGGFDEMFRGWGYEDTAFAAACETFGGVIRMEGEVWHFWHPTAKEGKRGTPSWSHNSSRGQRYRAAIGNREAIRAIAAESKPAWEWVPRGPGEIIPRILHRTVPERVDPEQDSRWAKFEELHPDWAMRTWRDPLDPADFPLTGSKWPFASTGAQLADMIRLEVLYRFGGVYVDADCDPLRPLDSLLGAQAFAAWEDERCVPNAVLGAIPGHPAIKACIDLMLDRIPGDVWPAGPGVTTEILPGRPDVLLLPPGSFYPVYYRDPERDAKMSDPDLRKRHPWAFVLHRYEGSWLKKRDAA